MTILLKSARYILNAVAGVIKIERTVIEIIIKYELKIFILVIC